MARAGILGDITEELETTVQKAAKQIKQLPSDVQQTASSQITPQPNDSGTNEQATGSVQQSQQQHSADQANKDVVKGLYAPSTQRKTNQKPSEYLEALLKRGFTVEEAQKLEKLRKELHDHYYQNLVNRPQPKEEPHAVRVEKQEEKKMTDLQEKKKKKLPPIAVDRAKHKTERFPGASG